MATPRQIASFADLKSIREAGRGYVINEHWPRGDLGPRPATLHLASCRTLETADYGYKRFATEWADAIGWLNEHKGQEYHGWDRCAICRPRPPGRALPRTTGPDATTRYIVSVLGGEPERRYGLLHRASCRVLTYTSVHRPFYFAEFEAAQQWAQTNLGKEGTVWARCKSCRPEPTPASTRLRPTQSGGTAQRLAAETTQSATAAKAPVVPQKENERGLGEAGADQGGELHGGPSPASLDALRTKLAVERAAREALEREHGALRSQIQTMEAQLADLREQMRALVEERDAAADEAANARRAVGRLEEELARARAELGRLQALSANPGQAESTLALIEVAEHLAERNVLEPGELLAVANIMHEWAKEEPDFRALRGIALSRLGRDKDAVAELERTLPEGVGSGLRGSALASLAISSLRIGTVPDVQEALDAVDWQDELAHAALLKLPIDSADQVLERIGPRLPRAALVEVLGRLMITVTSDSDRQRVVDRWFALDPGGAAAKILQVAEKPGGVDPSWLIDRLVQVLQSQQASPEVAHALAQTLARLPGLEAVARTREIVPTIDPRLGSQLRLRFGRAMTRGRLEQNVVDELASLLLDLPSSLHGRAESQEAADLLQRLARDAGEATREAIRNALEGEAHPRAEEPAQQATPPAYPESVVQALEWAAREYPALRITSRALTEARAWSSRETFKVWNFLKRLGDVAVAWREGKVRDVQAECAHLGHGFARGSSESSQNRYRQDYTVKDDDGVELLLGAHFKFASGKRLYLAFREDQRTIVIGAAKHLRIVSTK